MKLPDVKLSNDTAWTTLEAITFSLNDGWKRHKEPEQAALRAEKGK